jgi:succinoglycan biosynthesis transport protein ExoP
MSDELRTGPARHATGNEDEGRGGPRTRGSDGFYGGYNGYSDGGDGSETHLVDYLRTIYKHRWIALTAFALIFVYMAIRTFTATPIYEGRVQLLVESANPNVVNFKEVVQQDNYNYDFYPTQYAILKSRSLARRTIEALKLWDSPEFGGGNGEAGRSSEPGTVAPGETARQSGAIDAFLGSLTVVPVRNSRLVDVRFASPNPQQAAAVPNTLARQYIAQNLDYRFLSSKEASDWLNEQLAAERQKLEASEQALQRYREEGDAVALEDRQNIVVQRLADLNTAYTQARTARIEKEALYNQLRSLQNDRAALDTFPAILSNTFIQQLKSQLADLQRQKAQMAERLGEKHPEMIKLNSAIENTEAKLQGELGKVVQSVRNEFLSAQSQEKSLSAELESQKAGALALNRKGIEYGVLRRDAESNKQIYEALLQRAKETGISGELKASNIRVVDEAEVPRSPIRPNKPRNLLIGLLGGLVAGVGLAFFMDYIDNRLKNPDEVKHYLGVPFLGLVPALREKDLKDGRPPLVAAHVPHNFAEAIRRVRTAVQFSTAEEGCRTVLVTSTQPTEGKTLMAANLAISLAQAGQRVLLIDADMRKPRQHELLNVNQAPGLSNLLVGDAKANDAMRKTGTPNLWMMPSGPNPPNPAELLGSARFRSVLKTIAEHFDWVVLDSPPVMAVTDASVVAHLTTGVVYVVGSEQVNRHVARNAVEQLLGSKANILGAILNRVDVQGNPYYYAHYYKHEYAGYYTAEKSA